METQPLKELLKKLNSTIIIPMEFKYENNNSQDLEENLLNPIKLYKYYKETKEKRIFYVGTIEECINQIKLKLGE